MRFCASKDPQKKYEKMQERKLVTGLPDSGGGDLISDAQSPQEAIEERATLLWPVNDTKIVCH